jgi:hypothetical protein
MKRTRTLCPISITVTEKMLVQRHPHEPITVLYP